MDFEAKIEFTRIREILRTYCLSPLSHSHVDQIRFSAEWEEVVQWQEETEEFRQLLLFEPDFPLRAHADLRQELEYLRLPGSRIALESLCELKAALETMQEVLVFFRVEGGKEENRFPRLCALCSDVRVSNDFLRSVAAVVDEKGRIRDSASPALQQTRQQIHRIERDMEKNLRKMMVQAKQDHLMEQDAEMTIRNGRLCLPVPAAHKRRIKGFIHDESSTGQTVFIEPQEVFEANNDLRDLQLTEQREIQRILSELTDALRPLIPDILSAYLLLGYLDFVRAKAKFALDTHSVKPLLCNQPLLRWEKARHPLLFLALQRQHKEVVPLDITLEGDRRILIISGPNAGGKSVCLKTIGLLQYMLQCGMPVPASENSEFGHFHRLLMDIGDEQSIENDLSTYSSHLKNMDEIVRECDAESLFLIDELGGGTDPQYGGAIAEATLEHLSRQQAIGVVTTHFGNLKTMADTVPGIINGAMLFDKDRMQPLFRLQTGKAGSSFTFDIAGKIGFSPDIIAAAKAKIGTTQLDYEALLQKVELEKIALENERKMCAAMDSQLAELIAQQQQTNDSLMAQRHELMKKAKQEAESLLENANKIIEKTVREIKAKHAEKNQVRTLRENIQTFREQVKETPLPPAPKKKTPVPQSLPDTSPLAVGDHVIINESGTVGQLIERKGEDIVVSFQSVLFRTTVDKVSKTKQKPPQAGGKRSAEEMAFYTEMNRKASQFHLELDIRGMRAQEAEEALENYLDDALLLHIREVRIIHGKGDGILRKVVRECLARDRNVKSFRDEAMERGGYGATVVEL